MHGSMAGATNLLVARQPILDRDARVVAYELLARRTPREQTWQGGTEDSRTTSRVIRQAFLEMDVWSLTEGLPAYINFTRDLLLDGVAETLPPELAVIEILETIAPDAEVASACRRLRAAGYRVALDDVVVDDPRMVLLDAVDVVKLDVAATTIDERLALIERCRAAGVATLAEKVETPEQHDEAARLGCETWAVTLLVVLWLGARHPHPLRDTALSRARFCEQLTARFAAGTRVRPEDGYIVGLCSLLDAMVGEPLAAVLERIQLPALLAEACLHGSGELRDVLALVRA